ncbi:hypothetical protein Kpol_2002p8 [Vanderwaltozyma polyspora DSM 70294]|uniref:DNA replication checkpoint mediator MRC1 domain-containing protein n=1 Tax=Vanderwaltozyma polyspora (strain ATCC 22028 / DSM 70294 / BCRC 21397 / CBS 2163 / NBRC 10782 / NRRL Y-8283 / UCD 57-17) TaxID=436907 RepID=A7TFC4_VANPO|nr:uncharacterized protein Kpol_2002p8 [Vanderwaltozyma polyspora DSM 70294]EDO18938.1 hypothetical protein Kpol_2002p8 [Vanderwaltozyma polyspora DSM 70294]
MDFVFDGLDALKGKKRTTYKKVTDGDVEDEPKISEFNIELPGLGQSILFNNSKLKQIRNRLEGNNNDSENDSSQAETQVIADTQIISNLYEGGEDLEEKEERRFLQRTQIVEDHTQIIDASVTYSSKTIESNKMDNTQKYINASDSEPTQIQISKVDKLLKITDNLDSQKKVLDTTLETQELETQYGKTQVDKTQVDKTQVDKTQIFPTLVADDEIKHSSTAVQTVDDNTHSNSELKINEIERQLDEEDQILKEKSMGTEYKRNIAPVMSKVKFSKNDFLEHFDSSSSEEDEEGVVKLSSTEPETAAMNLENSLPQFSKESKFIGLSNYENILKKDINKQNCIEFSDSEDETEVTSKVSRASKATILSIKANLSRHKPAQSSINNKNALGNLFSDLKKATKAQILDHKKEIMEQKGYKMEEIEKEKEIVENLLEQEIERNRKIRIREKQKEELKKRKQRIENGDQEEDFAISANELSDSEVPESDNDGEVMSSNEEASDSDDELRTQLDASTGIEKETEQDASRDSEKDSERDIDEENILNIKNRKSKKIHVVSESDSDSDSGENSVQVEANHQPSLNTINLGHYGDNLSQENNNERNNIDSDESEDEELYKEMVKKEIDRRRDQERKQRQKLRELKDKGITDMFEVEAEESEDEWHGIGGVDGELSDEYDSEVEKMIDDYSKENFNAGEIREKLAAENKDMDLKMVNRILNDIKNGGFRKRRNALEIELSDDEDDDLKAYRAKRRQLMKEKRLETDHNKKLMTNKKSHAFLESMVDDIVEVKNPFDERDDNIMDDTPETDAEGDVNSNELLNKKKKFILSEAFVQKSLSFLSSSRNLEEFEMNNNLAKEQHSHAATDMFALKSHCSIKSLESLPGSHNNSISSKLDLLHEEIVSTPFSGLKQTSVIKSFSSSIDIDSKFKDGNKTVKVSKSYRTVGSAKASITYLGKARKLVPPKKKEHKPHSHKSKTASASRLFDEQDNSFEQ